MFEEDKGDPRGDHGPGVGSQEKDLIDIAGGLVRPDDERLSPDPWQAMGLKDCVAKAYIELPALLVRVHAGRSSGGFRPSHLTITLALLAVTRSTTPHRAVQSILPGRLLLLNAAAARAVSLTLSPRLIIFSPSVTLFPQP